MIAHVQLADFFMAVERAAWPELEGRPLIIGAATPHARVALASAEARERGVRIGMRMSDARSLVTDAACLSGSIERYLEVSAQIDERFRAVTHDIEWTAVDEAWLRIDGHAAARGVSLEEVRPAIERDFGIRMAIGVASTKAVAAVASRLMEPAGMLIVLRGYETRLLAPIDIARLPGLDAEAQARLRARGIHTLGQLAALDEVILRELIGCGGPVLARHARGIDDRPVTPGGVPKGIVRSAVCGSCGPTQATVAILQLAEQAAQALRRSGHASRQIRLRVRDAAGERIRVQTFQAAASDLEVAEHVALLARRLLHPGRDLLEAAVSLTALSPLPPQLELFASPRRSA